MMEEVLFISKIEDLRYFHGNFSRIYFGNEFCDRLLPSIRDLNRVLDFTSRKGIAFTFVTPYVTDKGLEKLKTLLQHIAEKRPDSEVVFNDYGVLRVLNKQNDGLVPVMGRLLTRMKRGPRLMTVIDKLPPTTVEYFRSSNLTVPILCEFLREHGVRRVELDNVLQGFDFWLDNLEASLYVPYAYVSTTRFCLTNSCDKPERSELIGIFPCQKECQRYTFFLRNEIMPVPLIRKGNTLFFKNEVLPEAIEERGITRIVMEPEIPI
jgi:hypothetical protein